jgi:hypothetical protein
MADDIRHPFLGNARRVSRTELSDLRFAARTLEGEVVKKDGDDN